MPFYLGIDTATGFVTRHRIAASVPEVAGVTWAEVSQAVYNATSVRRHPGDGPFRWIYDGSQVVEEQDGRPILRLSSTSATDEGYNLLISKQTGDPAATITVEVVNAQGAVRTNVTTSRQIKIGRRNVTISVVNGVGSLTVPTNYPRDVTLQNNQEFRVTKPLRVIVTESAPLADSEL